MATQGLKPVCAIYSTFLQRAYDPIIHDVCLQKLPVTFCMDRAGLSPNDGPTHHGLFDISFLRCLPNAIVMSPKDEDELQDMLKTSIQSKLPCFIRYPRGTGTGAKLKDGPQVITVGNAEELNSGSDISIWALGSFVETATKLAERISINFGLSVSVVNARFVKPLDDELLHIHAKKHKMIVTLEDGVLKGGFGSSILESINDAGIQTSIHRFGWPDEFIEHGESTDILRKKHKLDTDSIFVSLEKILKTQVEAVL
jgi:1-deoxy-D-xylulose-5-phosphate synthase